MTSIRIREPAVIALVLALAAALAFVVSVIALAFGRMNQHVGAETIGRNMGSYRSYPRIVGETGGKDFIVAHPSADTQALAVAIARGGYEYQGQKCSAASRAYIPLSLWTWLIVAGVAYVAWIAWRRRPHAFQTRIRGGVDRSGVRAVRAGQDQNCARGDYTLISHGR